MPAQKAAKLILCLLLLCLQQVALHAQSWYYRQYTAEQGLPSTEVYDILQDSKGYMWVATDRGVARFDGYAFESFTTAEGLSNNVVFKLCEGPDGKIWFAEMPGTLSYYQNGKVCPAPENTALKTHFKHNSFPVSLLPGKDYIDVGYEGYGIIRLQKGKIKELYPTEAVRDVIAVRGQEVISGFKRAGGPDDRTLVLEGSSKHYFRQKEWSFDRRRISALKRRNGDLMIAMSGVVRVFKPNGEVKKYVTDHITLLFETPDSCLYAVSNKGFYRYAPNEAFVPDNRFCHLKGYRVNKIIMDREGGLWVATLDKGVFYCAHSGFITYDFKGAYKGENNLVYSLCGDYKGKIFATLQNGAIYYINKEKAPVCIFQQRKSRIYDHIYFDTFNDRLLAYRTGEEINPAYRHEIKYERIYTGNGAVSYRQGYLTGNYSSLDVQLPQPGKKKWKVIHINMNEPKVQCMLRLAEDSIFIGTLSGLYLYRQGTLRSLLANTPYAQERINDIECIDRHTLVLATIGKGLLLYDTRNKRLERITTKEGLVSDVINDVTIAPDGSLWLASNKGLSRLKKEDRGSYLIRNYTSYNGIPVSDIKLVHADNGKIYLGTNDGLIVFDPQSRTIDHDPEILLRAVYVNDKRTGPEVLTQLGYRQNNLRISYLAIIPKMLGKVHYRYRLEGAKNDPYWVYIKEPQLFLTSVEPGDYRLIIQACNSAGQWSKVPLVLPIRILAPFWTTWWFVTCCILTAAGIVAFFLRFKLKRLRENAIGEKLMLDYRQQALINQINPHFLFNSMNSIQKYILRGDKEQAVSFVSKFAKLMRMGLEQSREAFIPLSSELELLKVYMLLEGERFGKKVTYHTEIQQGLEELGLLIPPMLIQPFIENALKHGILNKPGNGTVTLRLYLKETLLFCEVEDDGVGRKKALEIRQGQGQLHQSFAISINTSRLELLTRSLNSVYFFEITDKLDGNDSPAGTLVKLILPYQYGSELHYRG